MGEIQISSSILGRKIFSVGMAPWLEKLQIHKLFRNATYYLSRKCHIHQVYMHPKTKINIHFLDLKSLFILYPPHAFSPQLCSSDTFFYVCFFYLTECQFLK